MIIAIDGPAASGKGTLGRRLAAHFGLAHLDTGLLYRATAYELLSNGIALHDTAQAIAAARGLALTDFDVDILRAHSLGEAASIIAAMPQVRQVLLQSQRDFAARPGGAVLDGRDIGTVICPDADVKLFITASQTARAWRRMKEVTGRGERADIEKILEDIRRRDKRDASRPQAPLIAAPDAIMLDTSEMDAEKAFTASLSIVEAKIRT